MRLRIDGITAMSRGISWGKQNEKKKLPIRIKTAEFAYSLKTKRWFISHVKYMGRVSSRFTSLLIAVRTSTAAGPKCRSQLTAHKCRLALTTIWNRLLVLKETAYLRYKSIEQCPALLTCDLWPCVLYTCHIYSRYCIQRSNNDRFHP